MGTTALFLRGAGEPTKAPLPCQGDAEESLPETARASSAALTAGESGHLPAH